MSEVKGQSFSFLQMANALGHHSLAQQVVDLNHGIALLFFIDNEVDFSIGWVGIDIEKGCILLVYRSGIEHIDLQSL